MLAKFAFDVLQLYIRLTLMALALVWAAIGIALYMTPAWYVFVWLAKSGKGSVAGGAFMLVLVMTGLASVYVNALSRFVNVFHIGLRFLIDQSDKLPEKLKAEWTAKDEH